MNQIPSASILLFEGFFVLQTWDEIAAAVLFLLSLGTVWVNPKPMSLTIGFLVGSVSAVFVWNDIAHFLNRPDWYVTRSTIENIEIFGYGLKRPPLIATGRLLDPPVPDFTNPMYELHSEDGWTLSVSGLLPYPLAGICDHGANNSVCLGLFCKSDAIHFGLFGTGGLAQEAERISIIFDTGAEFSAVLRGVPGHAYMSYQAITTVPVDRRLLTELQGARSFFLVSHGSTKLFGLNGSEAAIEQLKRLC